MPPLIRFAALVITSLSVALLGLWLAYFRYVRWDIENDLRHRATKANTVVAVTIELDEFEQVANSRAVHIGQMVFAVAPDGAECRLVRRNNVADPTVPLVQRRLSLADGTVADVSDNLRVVTALATPNAALAHILDRYDPTSACRVRIGGYGVLPPSTLRRTIMGYDAVGYVDVTPTARVTTWMAPSLNCAELGRTEELLNAVGRATVVITLQARLAAQKTPDPALFAVPSTYERLNFSEHYRRSLELQRIPLPAEYLTRFSSQDQMYEQFHR